MPISTSTLFHFTKKRTTLEKILKQTFKIFYSVETIKIGEAIHSAAYPMVSFCDIPLSSIKNHLGSYGSYGIGLRKEWGIANRLNPVLYLESSSWLAEHFINSYHHVLNLPSEDDLTQEAQMGLIDVLRYTKNFEGRLERDGKKAIEKYRFSDEREWRYVPPFEQAMGFARAMEYKHRKGELNGRNDHLRLQFTADDIKYIVVKKESEVGAILKKITKIKGPIYEAEIVEKVKARVITAEQIFKDF
jgi:hypothetical protein